MARTRDGYASGDLRAELSGGEVVMATSAPDNSGVVRGFRVYASMAPASTWSRLLGTSRCGVPAVRGPGRPVASGSLLAPMPGSVVRLHVAAGTEVDAGQPVLVLEAMKMQHTVTAPHDGTVADLPVAVGGAGRRRRRPGSRDTPQPRRRVRMTEQTAFTETDERITLRRQVAKLAGGYGRDYFTAQARSGGKTTELWLEIGRNGYLGINIPEEYGGGGGGIGDVAAVCEELAAQGCPLLMMVVSPAICGTVINRFGTEEQKRRWLPGIADGTATMMAVPNRYDNSACLRAVRRITFVCRFVSDLIRHADGEGQIGEVPVVRVVVRLR